MRVRARANAATVGLLLISSSLCLWARDGTSKARAANLIRQVQEMSVSQLDPALPHVSLEKWLRIEAGADAEFRWEVNQCGEPTATAVERGHDFPVCVEGQSDMKDRRTIVVRISVGGFKEGASGKPTVQLAQLVTLNTTINLHQLSDLPLALIRAHRPVPREIAK